MIKEGRGAEERFDSTAVRERQRSGVRGQQSARGQKSEVRDRRAANGEAGSGRLAAGRHHEDVRDSPAGERGQRTEDRDQHELNEFRDRLIDPEDLARRFSREHIRGIGQAIRECVHNYKDLGKPWYEAGVRSAGNGTAMRAAPVGLVHLGDPYRIYRDSLLQSVVTHRDSMAIAAAACQAYAVARAAASLPGSLASLESRMALCADLAMLLEGLERPGYQLRGGSGATSLHGRIGTELPCYLQDDRAPFDNWYNGAYVLESLPCALWCFLHSPEDFEQTLFTAVDAGHDADTVAAMACSVAGAYHGYSRLPRRLIDDLEYHDRLHELADGLHELNRRPRGAP